MTPSSLPIVLNEDVRERKYQIWELIVSLVTASSPEVSELKNVKNRRQNGETNERQWRKYLRQKCNRLGEAVRGKAVIDGGFGVVGGGRNRGVFAVRRCTVQRRRLPPEALFVSSVTRTPNPKARGSVKQVMPGVTFKTVDHHGEPCVNRRELGSPTPLSTFPFSLSNGHGTGKDDDEDGDEGISSGINDEPPGTHGAEILPFGLEAEGQEAEPPLALHVHGLHDSSAVRAAPRRLLRPQHPLLLVAQKHYTHLNRPKRRIDGAKRRKRFLPSKPDCSFAFEAGIYRTEGLSHSLTLSLLPCWLAHVSLIRFNLFYFWVSEFSGFLTSEGVGIAADIASCQGSALTTVYRVEPSSVERVQMQTADFAKLSIGWVASCKETDAERCVRGTAV
ncbi:hypothetical protein H6P81_009165 [Aristolochia fimbriata]|uniref:Uncharacterized protein n=1 Tax=Aristolochia fimbriata TaxID=158543 RepID=A0AAV7EM75_ARIFI|nr:hypothetical protein H6P81_009165 [Aristolochia fimbriata]